MEMYETYIKVRAVLTQNGLNLWCTEALYKLTKFHLFSGFSTHTFTCIYAQEVVRNPPLFIQWLLNIFNFLIFLNTYPFLL